MTIRNVIIIGSGVAGYSAAIYAARSDLKPLLISGLQEGGQLTLTTDVENYPGFATAVQGPDLMDQMREQAINAGTEIIDDQVLKVNFSDSPFKVFCQGDDNAEYQTKTVIVATGASAKWLGLESEAKYRGHGVSGCATCDGFFFRDKVVMVVGGGNTAVEEALFLTKYATKVILLHRRDSLRADKIMQNRLFKNDKIEVIWNSQLKEVLGTGEGIEKTVTGVEIENTLDQKTSSIDLDGVFIAIGHKPNTDIFVDSGLQIDKEGYLETKVGTTNTNIAGIFAAGDVQDKIYRQAVTAAGTGCMAALDADRFLNH